MAKHYSFRVIRKTDGMELPKGFPFWIGTFIGSFFVIFVFAVALVDINRAVETHSSTLDFLNFEALRSKVRHVQPKAQDNAAPRLVLVEPLQNALLSGTALVSVSVADRVGEIAAVQFYVDGRPIAQLASPYRFSWDTTAEANGEHTLRVVATDKAGNEAAVNAKVMVEN